MKTEQNTWVRFLLIAYFIFLVIVLLTPNPDGQGAFWELISFTGAAERTLNFLLFMPMPVLLAKSFPRIGSLAVVIIGIATPMSVEFLQIYIPGRVSDPIDVIANFSGFLTSFYFWLKSTKTN